MLQYSHMEKAQSTVLIIEDNVSLADSLVDLLELHGHKTLHSRTGEGGLSLAETEKPDLVMLDIRLPDISGYEVYTRLREKEWGENIKALVITASESIEHIAQNIDLPQDHILFKPSWSMADLIARIEKELSA